MRHDELAVHSAPAAVADAAAALQAGVVSLATTVNSAPPEEPARSVSVCDVTLCCEYVPPPLFLLTVHTTGALAVNLCACPSRLMPSCGRMVSDPAAAALSARASNAATASAT